MSGSVEVERKIGVFTDIGNIIDAMKGFAGVAFRKSEGIIANIREYDEKVKLALAESMASEGEIRSAGSDGAKRLVVAFGSSQGLCGAYNERIADLLATVMEDDSLYVVGRRLRSALECRGIGHDAYQESVAGVGGLEQAWRECISRLLEIYRQGGYYVLTLVFTVVSANRAEVKVERLLPPDVSASRGEGNHDPPLSYLEPAQLLQKVLEEFIGIGLYRALVEALRSENWYRLRSMEGASDNIRRHIEDMESFHRYLRQEEITGELLEILGSGGFFGGMKE